MRKIASILFLFSFLLLLVSIFVFIFSSQPIEKKSIYTSVNLTVGSAGFDLNGSALTFGNIALGGSGSRDLLVENNRDFPILVVSKVRGDIEDLLVFKKKTRIEPWESASIGVTALADKNIKTGFYSGEFEFEIIPV
jgi:hypothetical protein